ncbi:protein with putative role during mitosis [Coelomomyces lativittatus]|nr:protein with putative role during mitosis [Coelomomyces lativittatus]
MNESMSMEGSNGSLHSLTNNHLNIDKPVFHLSILTSKQTEELQKSIIDYLHAQRFTNTLKAFQDEANLQIIPSQLEPKFTGLLEKKWSSVVRLQKKILELESKVTQLQQTLDQVPLSSASSSSSTSTLNALPRGPERHCLKGHRAPITSLAFHPIYQQLASSSEDATIKLWDFETGEYEKSLKGHTKSITHITYDEEGKYLGETFFFFFFFFFSPVLLSSLKSNRS